MRDMLCCLLFVINFNLFGMEDDKKEQSSDSFSVAIPVATQSQDESRRKSSLGLHAGCCAICYEPIDDSVVRKVLACCHERDSKIKCSTCTAVYHRSCLEKFFSISSSVEARAHQCPSRCGTMLIPLPCSQRLARWCRKNLLMLSVLFLGNIVVFSLISKYSQPSMYVFLGIALGIFLALFRGGCELMKEVNLADQEHFNELREEAKKILCVDAAGVIAIAGALLVRCLVLE